MSTVVLCSGLPGDIFYRSDRFEIRRATCRKPTDYSDALRDVWSTDGPIINIEHDMETSDALIIRLLACRAPLCTWAYQLPHLDHYAQRQGFHPNAGGRWIDEGEQWCEFTGIGFCKMRSDARKDGLDRTDWSGVEGAVRYATIGRWHVHWPEIEHYHPAA